MTSNKVWTGFCDHWRVSLRVRKVAAERGCMQLHADVSPGVRIDHQKGSILNHSVAATGSRLLQHVRPSGKEMC